MKPSSLKSSGLNTSGLKHTPASTAAGLAAAVAAIVCSANACAAEPPTGKQLFERYCAQCHAPGYGHPGTMQLERVRGKALAVLEERKDLVPAYIMAVVRNGLVEMPPYRPTEIDDASLSALALYLAPGKPVAKPRKPAR